MLLKTKIEIEKWLNKYDIKKYELIENKEYGYIVNVNDHVYLSHNELKSIDVKFNEIKGFFYCQNNQLMSLEGCPEIVGETFDCCYNNLISLIGCPKIVKGDFDCSLNKLISIEDCPEIINGNFNCSENKLTSFIGVKTIVGGNFYCNDNKLINLNLNLDLIEIQNNYIYLENNPELGKLQKITDFNELKKIINIYQEKTDLIMKIESANIVKAIKVTDSSVESTDIIVAVKINKI